MIRNIGGFILVGISLAILIMYIVKGEQNVAQILWKDKTALMLLSLVVGITLLILNRILLGSVLTALGFLIAITKLIKN